MTDRPSPQTPPRPRPRGVRTAGDHTVRSRSARTRTARTMLGTVGALTACTLLLAACTVPGTAARQKDGRPLVLTTFTVLADIAENVAADHLRVESITKPGAEIHGYEPTPGDIRHAAEADLILDNGLGLEAWFEQFVATAETPHVVLSEGVEVMDITGDAAAGKPNPHAWMSPENVGIYVQNMVTAFSKLDPAHAADFEAAGEKYRGELTAVSEELQSRLEAVPAAQRALVTCEGAFSYLAREAELKEAYIWPVNAEHEATPKQVAAAIEFVESNDVPAVFCESTVNDKPMQQIAEATGARYAGTLYVDSLSDASGPVPTYLDLIRHDADTIAAGLTGQAAPSGTPAGKPAESSAETPAETNGAGAADAPPNADRIAAPRQQAATLTAAGGRR